MLFGPPNNAKLKINFIQIHFMQNFDIIYVLVHFDVVVIVRKWLPIYFPATFSQRNRASPRLT